MKQLEEKAFSANPCVLAFTEFILMIYTARQVQEAYEILHDHFSGTTQADPIKENVLTEWVNEVFSMAEVVIASISRRRAPHRSASICRMMASSRETKNCGRLQLGYFSNFDPGEPLSQRLGPQGTHHVPENATPMARVSQEIRHGLVEPQSHEPDPRGRVCKFPGSRLEPPVLKCATPGAISVGGARGARGRAADAKRGRAAGEWGM